MQFIVIRSFFPTSLFWIWLFWWYCCSPGKVNSSSQEIFKSQICYLLDLDILPHSSLQVLNHLHPSLIINQTGYPAPLDKIDDSIENSGSESKPGSLPSLHPKPHHKWLMNIIHLGSPHPSNSSSPMYVVRGVQREVVVDDMSHLQRISWISTTSILLNMLTSWVSRPRDIKSVAEIILTCNFMNESTLTGFQKFLLHLPSQKFVQAFSSLNEVLSLTEANAVNVIFFQEHLNKIGSGGLVAENHHLKKFYLQFTLRWTHLISDLIALAHIFLQCLQQCLGFIVCSYSQEFLNPKIIVSYASTGTKQKASAQSLKKSADLRHMEHYPMDLICRHFQHFLRKISV